jgi:hypothetical protein
VDEHDGRAHGLIVRKHDRPRERGTVTGEFDVLGALVCANAWFGDEE